MSAAAAIALSALAMRCTAFGTADALGDASQDGAPKTDDAAQGDASNLDGPNGGFCSEHADASFCADFDEDLDVESGWTRPDISGSGSVSETTAQFRSKPRALRAQLSSAGQARLIWEYPSAVRKTNVSFDFRGARPADLPSGESDSVVELLCQSAAAASDGVWLHWVPAPGGGTKLVLRTRNGDGSYDLPMPPQDWVRIGIAVSWGPPTTYLDVTYDGITVHDRIVDSVLCVKSALTQVVVGPTSPGTPIEAFYDNVLVDLGQ
jgi:hypothetical protein